MDYITEALQNYNMESAKTELIRHNENMTIKVEDKFLLRIHKHADGFTTDYLYESLDRKAIYREEVRFLSYLHDNGMLVQTPMKNKYGDEVTMLSDGTLVTMLTWLQGHAMEPEDISRESCYKIGEMVAKFHRLAKGYVPATMLKYDADLCASLKDKIYLAGQSNQAKENGLLKQEYFDSMSGACEVIARRLQDNASEFLPVHSDLSLSNLLITEEGIVPIDFSLFGYGHPMMDIGALYCSRLNSQENRQNVAMGYKAAGGSIDLELLDCCFALNVLLGVGLHLEHWMEQEWFPSRLERWCQEMFEPLNEGKALFSLDFYLLNVK